MSSRGYNVAIVVVAMAIVVVVGYPYAKPYLDDVRTATTAVDPTQTARHPAQFDGLYKTGRALGAATDVGVNYARYGELLANMATEYEIANDKVTDRVDRDVLGGYGRALSAYRVAGELWSMKIRSDRSARTDLIPLLEDEHVVVSLNRVNGDIESELQRLWRDGRIRLEAANGRVNTK